MAAMYEAMHEAHPFPDDTRIFLREWPLYSVSQNGQLGSEPAPPVFIVHVPQDANLDAKRKMLASTNATVADAYPFPDFAIFLHRHSLDTVVINGVILADDHQRVEDQRGLQLIDDRDDAVGSRRPPVPLRGVFRVVR